MEENIKVTHKKYHITLLTNLFIGFLGVHRIINKKFITGFIMLGFGLLSIILWIFSLVFDSSILFGFAMTIFIILNIVKFVDMILIFVSWFKDKHGNVIAANKPFINVWSNIVAIVVIVLSLLFSSIAGIVFAFSSSTSNKDISNELKDCFSARDAFYDDDIEPFDGFDDIDKVIKYIEKKGYNYSDDEIPYEYNFYRTLDDELYISMYIIIYPDESAACYFNLDYVPENEDAKYTVYAKDFDGAYSGRVTYSSSESYYLGTDSDGDINEYSDDISEKEEELFMEAVDIYSIEYRNLFK